jgi:LAO/AO transport system kinase
MALSDDDLVGRLRRGEVRALARAIRLVEDRSHEAVPLMRSLGAVPPGHVVGVTGPPGAGKSTLCDLIIEAWRGLGHSVGVIAVDPSSPFSGGAILGDRVRMQRHTGDAGVYIRSMAARGHLGGLSIASREVVRLLLASGHDRCLLETVGVGQSELEVMQTADTTVVVTTPASGDAVQIIKAGILEIGDIFVINKSDLPGAPRVSKELREMIHLSRHSMAAPSGRHVGAWEPPVILTNAANGDHIPEVVEALAAHHRHLEESGEGVVRARERLRAEVEGIVVDRAAQWAQQALESATMERELERGPADVDPYALAEIILADMRPAQGVPL